MEVIWEKKRLEKGEKELLRGIKIDDRAGQIPAGEECARNPVVCPGCWGLQSPAQPSHIFCLLRGSFVELANFFEHM